MIITKIEGGMGNQMFQYAIGRAISIKNNTELGLYLDFLLDRNFKPDFTFRNYSLDVFNIEAKIVDRSKVPFIYRHYNKGILSYIVRIINFILIKILRIKMEGKEKNSNFDSTVLLAHGNSYIEGYWQSEKYFSDISEIIRKDFTLKNNIPINIKNLIEIIKKENSLCIHVRRGDYVGNINHEIVGREYYNEGIENIKSLTKIDKIYLFSDDINWCKENMKFEFPTMFVGDEYAGENAEWHHILMRSCKNFIIPNSTFSWWAAWLSDSKDKIVIAPKQWFPNGSLHIDNIDIIPDSWIKI